MLELIQKIEQWAEDRNIIKGSTPIDQAMKLFSEFGELSDHVGDNELSKIPDDVGDIFVVLTIISKQYSEGFMIDTINNIESLEDLSKLTSIKHVVHVLMSHLYSFVFSVEDSKFCDPAYDLDSCLAYLSKIAELIGTDLESCVKLAYDDIKDRKGVLIDGVFIKESNPAYAKAIQSLEGNYSIEDSK